MRILIDMNLSPRWVEFLLASRIDASHWSNLGPATAPDAEIMAYAAGGGFIVLTHDLDFSAILAATQGMKPSVIQIRSDEVSPESIGKTVLSALRQAEQELEVGALLTIDTKRARLAILPLRGS